MSVTLKYSMKMISMVSPNKLGWTSICLLDQGSNIHSQNFNIEEDFLPKIKINSLSELLKL